MDLIVRRLPVTSFADRPLPARGPLHELSIQVGQVMASPSILSSQTYRDGVTAEELANALVEGAELVSSNAFERDSIGAACRTGANRVDAGAPTRWGRRLCGEELGCAASSDGSSLMSASYAAPPRSSRAGRARGTRSCFLDLLAELGDAPLYVAGA